MACPSCRTALNLLPKGRPVTKSSIVSSSRFLSSRPTPSSATSTPPTTRQIQQQRSLHTTPSPLISFREIIGKRIANLAGNQSPYFIYTATERLYKQCAAQADYDISKDARKKKELKETEEGEEIGVFKIKNPWHDEFGLLPTFSTWAHVTMLHMYLLVVRLRNTEKIHQAAWQEQLVNHFFYQAEAKMEITHNLSSRVIRQTYLKDLFVQWRGLIMSCDEGLIKGDAVLASAVWRNLFKANEDVDLRSLAAVVSWMRSGIKKLDALPDELVWNSGEMVFKNLVVSEELRGVDVPSAVMRGEFVKEGLVR
ncbi:CBP3-like protein [Podospora fimiseda]|uniref:CBP3-like protein n=1 Tax=Podospora fimiseda TaxID=252190 RepID=A0AAN7BDY6_9PEZI|nr:CBP3-like protein [Podospora fimiseda]